jgi:hypothetical protein
VNPPGGADPFKLTVPVVGTPAETVDGLRLRLLTSRGWMTREAEKTSLPLTAVTFTISLERTGEVETANVAVSEPLGTVTESGTETAELLTLRDTAMPVVGAGPVSETVPVEDVPPTREFGSIVREASFAGKTFKVATVAAPPNEARIIACDITATIEVDTENVPVAAPAGIFKEDGMLAKSALVDNFTLIDWLGGLVSVTVPVELFPPVTEAGANVKDAMLCANALN